MNPDPSAQRPPQKWQFGLRSMFRFMLLAAVVLGLMKWWGIAKFILAGIFAAPLFLCLRRPRPELAMIKCLIVYFTLSMLTLPFIDDLWLGEIPLLTVVQWPKTLFAWSVRNLLTDHIMGPLGLSSGWASPDSIAARPYALAIAYAVPIGIFLGVIFYRTKLNRLYLVWVLALLLFAVADFFMMLDFADSRGLTIY
jgi:hypothetical protein